MSCSSCTRGRRRGSLQCGGRCGGGHRHARAHQAGGGCRVLASATKDLNGDGVLEEGELVRLNEQIALLHHGEEADTAAVRPDGRVQQREGNGPKPGVLLGGGHAAQAPGNSWACFGAPAPHPLLPSQI
ncbi:unnamed protein product [Prorocentrum cordatum]|uniref:EF-hand domain-containing protein n=1 Tax=Prorocentrum cordatum TaxID=2364126 RepID=A0ABN9RWA2_9DINO|nr:unnamed protein product [Polarella glacialis]